MSKQTETLELVTGDEFALPTQLSEPEVNPTSMIIFGKHKCGKTTKLSELENCLIVDTEKGTSKVAALKIEVPQDKGPASKMIWLNQLADKLLQHCPYDYIALDTLTEVNEWAEWSGTLRYMNSPQGKSFNRVRDERGNPIKGGDFLDPNDPAYESVHTLGEGYGYRWSREEVMRVFDKFLKLPVKCVFFVCHVEDKYIAQKDATETAIKQIAVTGKLRDILPRKVDSIGYVYNKDSTISVNFTGSEDRVGGTRAKHLIGYNGPFAWDKIFI